MGIRNRRSMDSFSKVHLCYFKSMEFSIQAILTEDSKLPLSLIENRRANNIPYALIGSMPIYLYQKHYHSDEHLICFCQIKVLSTAFICKCQFKVLVLSIDRFRMDRMLFLNTHAYILWILRRLCSRKVCFMFLFSS